MLVVLVASALLATGCGGRKGSSREDGATASTTPVSGDVGDLKDVCRAGVVTSSPAQGVTADQIKVGVFSDVGFTKNSEFVDAAKVFTSWCNDAGGINGRKLVPVTRDTQMLQVRQQMLNSCKEDFAVVGGGAALDGLGVKDRLSCLMPSFPGQVTQTSSLGSDLQVAQLGGASYSRYQGYYRWLVQEAYPASAGAVGIIAGDSPVTKVLRDQLTEVVAGVGGTVSYSDLYPAQGVSDWTPYAQSIKSKGVKGLIFMGDFSSLAKLEQILTNIGYQLDWIDANNNAYGPQFIQLAGQSLTFQNNFADLSGMYPLEKAADNPATKQVIDLFAKYAPGAKVTLPAVRAITAWLLFAKAAETCGDALTRKCVYEAALKETAWTGGGLQAPVDLSQQDGPVKCFDVEHATPNGWQPADFKPDNGAFRCDAPARRYTGSYGKPATLADVGKTMGDFR
jgi:ABC-type branched-subunit amino acid transport system substrate-binding protein